MPKKTFNSKTAEDLANKYKISVTKIPTTRYDKKITIQNVKDYIKSLKDKLKKEKPKKETKPKVEKPKKEKPKKEKPKVEKPKVEKPKVVKPKVVKPKKEIVGYHIKLLIDSGTEYPLNYKGADKMFNLKQLQKYYADQIHKVGWMVDGFENEKVSIDSKKNKIVIEYDMMQTDQNEIDLSIQFVQTLDDDGNYPVLVRNGRIIEVNARELDRDKWGDEDGNIQGLSLITIKIVNRKITPIRK